VFELCLCASQDLEKAAKVSHDLEKQVQQLQKQCADTEAAATSKEVCTYQLSWLMVCGKDCCCKGYCTYNNGSTACAAVLPSV
jgi:hypothetical protein